MTPKHASRLELHSPILKPEEMEAIKAMSFRGWETKVRGGWWAVGISSCLLGWWAVEAHSQGRSCQFADPAAPHHAPFAPPSPAPLPNTTAAR